MFESLIDGCIQFFNSKVVFILLTAVVTISVALLLNRLLKKTYWKLLECIYSRDKSLLAQMVVTDQTKFHLIRRILVSIIYISGILIIISGIPELKKLSYSIFAGAGVLALIIGFATQKFLTNIISGMFISSFEPFRIGDLIQVGDDQGYVEDITLWHTIVRTFENKRLMIPNSVISDERIVNETITDEKVLNFVDFGISYDADVDKAMKIIADEVVKSPYFIDNKQQSHLLASGDLYKLRVVEWEDSGLTLRLYVWTANSIDGYFIKYSLLEDVKKRFDEEGIEIPYPHRKIVTEEPKKSSTKKKKNRTSSRSKKRS